ncbi:MAG: hypothetical protein R3301_07115 [Saprospiraceae bacterium]|nr:hypothetical protein [Saprospiraceae bacterium]
MPTPRKDQLFSLIKSLTKAEKRNFRLYVQRLQSNEDVKFVRLFDVLDKMDTYDSALLAKKMRGVTRSQLANLRRHLYTQILKSLRLIHIEKNVDIQIREQLDHAKILYEKGLYLQALKLLERIKGVADKTHQDLLRMEIIEFQKYIEERHITRSRRVRGKMEHLLQEADLLERSISNMVRLSNLKIRIHGLYITMGHARNEKDHYVVKEYFHSELEKISEKTLSVTERVFLEQSYMWYYYILLDYEQCHAHAARWVQLFEANPQMKEDDPVLYMRGLSYELTTLYSLRKYQLYLKSLQKFEQFGEANEKRFTTTQRIIHFLYLTTARINRHFLEGSFSEGITLVPHIERQIRRYREHMDVHRIMVFNYKIAWLFFGAGDYARSIDYLNEIIQLRAGHLREDIQCYARLLHMINHYELGHRDLLKYQIQSVSRFFEKMQDLNRVQAAVLEFFRKDIASDGPADRAELEQLRARIEVLSSEPYERRAFQHLDILSWIDSKISRKSLAQVIQQRFRKDRKG